MSFAGWLITNRWVTVLWHGGDDAGALLLAMKAKNNVSMLRSEQGGTCM